MQVAVHVRHINVVVVEQSLPDVQSRLEMRHSRVILGHVSR
jgi:hypothetical protein